MSTSVARSPRPSAPTTNVRPSGQGARNSRHNGRQGPSSASIPPSARPSVPLVFSPVSPASQPNRPFPNRTPNPGFHPPACVGTGCSHRVPRVPGDASYLLRSTLPVREDTQHEFKIAQGAVSVKTIISKYVVAFLNTRGGTLYLGVNDDAQAIGIKLPCRHAVDDFSLMIGQCIDMVKPQVDPKLVSYRFVPVVRTRRGNSSTKEFVVEIKVDIHKPLVQSFYVCPSGEAFGRRDASCVKLKDVVLKQRNPELWLQIKTASHLSTNGRGPSRPHPRPSSHPRPHHHRRPRGPSRHQRTESRAAIVPSSIPSILSGSTQPSSVPLVKQPGIPAVQPQPSSAPLEGLFGRSWGWITSLWNIQPPVQPKPAPRTKGGTIPWIH